MSIVLVASHHYGRSIHANRDAPIIVVIPALAQLPSGPLAKHSQEVAATRLAAGDAVNGLIDKPDRRNRILLNRDPGDVAILIDDMPVLGSTAVPASHSPDRGVKFDLPEDGAFVSFRNNFMDIVKAFDGYVPRVLHIAVADRADLYIAHDWRSCHRSYDV
jgi:hypothetical protein